MGLLASSMGSKSGSCHPFATWGREYTFREHPLLGPSVTGSVSMARNPSVTRWGSTFLTVRSEQRDSRAMCNCVGLAMPARSA